MPPDPTPEILRELMARELSRFGELMRRAGPSRVPTTNLSRQTVGIGGRALYNNLPGKPVAIDLYFAPCPGLSSRIFIAGR